jgi:hypoxanthine-guanine phosphoribosyltransferase
MNIIEFQGEKYEILLTEKQLNGIIGRLAKKALSVLKKKSITKIVVVVVYKGAIYFATKFLIYLSKYILEENLNIDVIDDGIIVRAYDEDNVPLANIEILYDLQTNVRGEHVFILEDYSDRCITFPAVIRNIENRCPASLTSFAMLGNSEFNHKLKELKKTNDIEIGKILDKPGWISGYGLDNKHKGRGWPCIVRKIVAD